MFGLQTLPYKSLIGVAVAGFIAGALQLTVFLGLEWATVRANGPSEEAYIPITLMVVAIIFAHFLGMIGLIRLSVLRPLLVILAAIATLWGTWNWAGGFDWWIQVLLAGGFFAAGYAYYAWVNRLLVFPVALAVTVLSVLLARVIFIAV